MRPLRGADNLTTFMYLMSWNLGASISWSSKGVSRPVWGVIKIFTYCYHGALERVKGTELEDLHWLRVASSNWLLRARKLICKLPNIRVIYRVYESLGFSRTAVLGFSQGWCCSAKVFRDVNATSTFRGVVVPWVTNMILSFTFNFLCSSFFTTLRQPAVV
jgi:hypothetical protein